jgi:predicted SprT family Zn-dependent metalloprotease
MKKNYLLDQLKKQGLTTINAGYREYELKFAPHIHHSGDECLGLTEFETGVITLNNKMATEVFRETLIHELTHLVLDLGGLGGDEKTDKVLAMTNEAMTIQISRGWMMLMRLNPELFTLLNYYEE